MSNKSLLFSPFKLRELNFKNRIVVSPMCQYSATEGVPNHWHLVHLGSRAVGGAALVICEATGVSAEGRISPGDTGLWNEKQVQAFAPITAFIKSQNSIPGIQLGARRAQSLYAHSLGDRANPFTQRRRLDTHRPRVPFPLMKNLRLLKK